MLQIFQLTNFEQKTNNILTCIRHYSTAKGMTCNTNQDCANILHTSCVQDPDDKVDRCLCGDDSTPVNGFCPKTIKSNYCFFHYSRVFGTFLRSMIRHCSSSFTRRSLKYSCQTNKISKHETPFLVQLIWDETMEWSTT